METENPLKVERLLAAEKEFCEARELASQSNLELRRCSETHFQLRSRHRSFQINIYPTKHRLWGERNSGRCPHLKVPSDWTMCDVVRAAAEQWPPDDVSIEHQGFDVTAIYEGSNGDLTSALYRHLESLGPRGVVAMNLFRASKCSARAKLYVSKRKTRTNRGYSNDAYSRKEWSLGLLCRCLAAEASSLRIGWGWSRDESSVGFEDVIYVDLPNGQCSFHNAKRLTGPDYLGQWSGKFDSKIVVLDFVKSVLQEGMPACDTK